MIAILTLFVVVTLSILVTRVATIALTHTGLSQQSARFQARSAFTGAGFTTAESEKVVNHPVRRRIVLTLMLLGNAGLVTAVSSLILAFVGDTRSGLSGGAKVGLLVAGLAVLWAVTMSSWVDRHLSHLIDWALRRWTDLDVRDYAGLMHLGGDYRLAELHVEPGDWLANQMLAGSRLGDEGVVVLGITRKDGTYLGAPTRETRIVPGDNLTVYGQTEVLQEIDRRERDARGDEAHRRAAVGQALRRLEEAQRDPERPEVAPPAAETPGAEPADPDAAEEPPEPRRRDSR